MSDLIKREDVQREIQASFDGGAFRWQDGQDLLDRINALPPASPWHRVEDELPNDGEWAIFTNGKVVTVERFKEDAYNHFFPASQWFDFEDAIAWMALPEPPEE